jgi:hypothetical protein
MKISINYLTFKSEFVMHSTSMIKKNNKQHFFHLRAHLLCLLGVRWMYEWMNVCVVGHNLTLALRPSVIYCSSPLINPLLILHFKWNVGLYLWGHHSSYLVPKITDPGDEILNKLWPHNHIGYVWLMHLVLGVFHMWGCLSIPVEKVSL